MEPVKDDLVVAETAVDKWVLQLLNPRRLRIEKVLPKHLSVERFIMQVSMLIAKVPKLQACTPASLVKAIVDCADLGLDPSGRLGSAYILPFKGEAVLVPGYRGLIDLSCRAGFVKSVNAWCIYDKDRWRDIKGKTPVHEPYFAKAGEQHDAGPIIGAWARAKLVAGGEECEVMYRFELDAIKARSPAVRGGFNSPWDTDEPEMFKKTVVKRLMKDLPMSSVESPAAERYARAIELDDDFESARGPALEAVVGGQVTAQDDVVESLKKSLK